MKFLMCRLLCYCIAVSLWELGFEPFGTGLTYLGLTYVRVRVYICVEAGALFYLADRGNKSSVPKNSPL